MSNYNRKYLWEQISSLMSVFERMQSESRQTFDHCNQTFDQHTFLTRCKPSRYARRHFCFDVLYPAFWREILSPVPVSQIA